MFGMGMGEILLIAVVALLVVGPDKLPGAAKAIGKGIRDLRASTKDLQSTIEEDTQIGDAVRELRGALRGDPETLYKRATGEDFNAPPPEKGESEFPKAPKKEDGEAKADGADGGDTDEADDDDNAAKPETDKELGDLLDKAYANSNDGWGAVATNPHEQEEAAPDPDVPVIKQPAGSVARATPQDDRGDSNSDDSDSGDSDSGDSSNG